MVEVSLLSMHNYQFGAFSSWRLHEREIQVQGNSKFFFLAASRKEDTLKPLGPGYCLKETLEMVSK